MVGNTLFNQVIDNTARLVNLERSLIDAVVLEHISITNNQTVIQFYCKKLDLTGNATVCFSMGTGFMDLKDKKVLIYRSYEDGFFVISVLSY